MNGFSWKFQEMLTMDHGTDDYNWEFALTFDLPEGNFDHKATFYLM